MKVGAAVIVPQVIPGLRVRVRLGSGPGRLRNSVWSLPSVLHDRIKVGIVTFSNRLPGQLSLSHRDWPLAHWARRAWHCGSDCAVSRPRPGPAAASLPSTRTPPEAGLGDVSESWKDRSRPRGWVTWKEWPAMPVCRGNIRATDLKRTNNLRGRTVINSNATIHLRRRPTRNEQSQRSVCM